MKELKSQEEAIRAFATEVMSLSYEEPTSPQKTIKKDGKENFVCEELKAFLHTFEI